MSNVNVTAPQPTLSSDGQSLTFPDRLAEIAAVMRGQSAKLAQVAVWYADALESGGLIHAYANGHSRIALEEMVVRMGALAGFHPVLAHALANFTDVVGNDGLRLNQAIEKVEGLGVVLLDEMAIGAKDVFVVISATGQTQAAVDFALTVSERYPNNPLVVLASITQSQQAEPKHSSGKTLFHVAQDHAHAVHLDNAMPMGDLSTTVSTPGIQVQACPLSSIGALTVVQCLNELTLRELGSRGIAHPVLQNMHLGGYGVNYNAWLAEQRKRYARVLHNPDAVPPHIPTVR